MEISKFRGRRKQPEAHQWSRKDSLVHQSLVDQLARLCALNPMLGASGAHLVLQLLPAALHCAAQAALLGLLFISNLSIADGDFGLVRRGGAGVAHETL